MPYRESALDTLHYGMTYSAGGREFSESMVVDDSVMTEAHGNLTLYFPQEQWFSIC